MSDNHEEDSDSQEELEQPSFEVSVSVAPKINLALQHNSVPVLRELAIINNTGQTAENLSVHIYSDPAFLKDREWNIDRLDPDSHFHLTDLKIGVSRSFLDGLTEAVRGTISVALQQGNEVLASVSTDVEVLARDEWGGCNDLPEIIAAFIQPNDPAVATILKDASRLLRSNNLDPSFDGYQAASPKRVIQVVSAIWSAVASKSVSYAVPPASFETVGQKIRMPGRLLREKLASCLDLAVLFASCAEQAGLHPIIVFQKGHAFVGCWLQDEDFSRQVVDDIQALRKRVQLNELTVFETTFVTSAPPAKFSFAVQEAKSKLDDEEKFELAIDINRARQTRIRPLAEVISTSRQEPTESAVEGGPEFGIDIPSDVPDETEYEPQLPQVDIATETPAARLERWKRKLLDLSLRNRLLHFKASKRAAVIDCPDPAKLEDSLADGKKFKLIPSPDFEEGSDPRSSQLHKDQRHEDLKQEHAHRALGRGELLVSQTSEKLDASLIELYRASRSAMEEGGSNILYIAIGFLVWTRPEKPDRKLRAPLLLVPVQLTRRSVRSGFQLALHEDEVRFNPTLLQMLRQDFHLRMPELEGELPADEHGFDVLKIWNIVRRAVRDIASWEVVEDVVLSTFSFAKYLMWQDLSARTDQLRQSPVVRHLIDTPREPYGSGDADFPDAARLDDERHPEQTFCPMLADSSQLAAVIAAAEGKDYVLVGPPGTGKSQTIANMVAQCLAENKTVLFVSEKTAALDVVYRRLHKIGLSEFCLELHSNKARKFDVLKQLEMAWEAKGNIDTSQWEREASRLRNLRDDLNQYVRRLHLRHRNGWTAYEAMGLVIRDNHIPHVHLTWSTADAHDQDDYQDLLEIAQQIDVDAEQVGGITNNPLRNIAQGEWSPSWQSTFLSTVRGILKSTNTLEQAVREYCSFISIDLNDASGAQLAALLMLHTLLMKAYAKPYGFLFEANGTSILSDMKKAKSHIENYKAKMAATSVPYERSATELQLSELEQLWAQSKTAWFGKRWLLEAKVRKALRLTAVSHGKSTEIEKDIENLQAAGIEEEATDALAYLGTTLTGLWRGLDTDTETLSKAIKWADGIVSTVPRLTSSADEIAAVNQAVRNVVVEGNSLLVADGPLSQRGEALYQELKEHQEICTNLAGLIEVSAKDLLDPGAKGYISRLLGVCNDWIGAENKLRYWCAWRTVRARAAEKNLLPLVQEIESGAARAVSAEQLFQVNYARWWLNSTVDNDEVLRKFVPAEHEHRISEFSRLDKKFMELTQSYVRATLCGHIPIRGASSSRDSEWSVLSRELQKKKRHMPLRQLISKMPNTLTRLTPCVMMSPLSIAQYLSPDMKPFDVVIFDEASQIPVWDAVGAIARGSQAIVVGDPKQLPPTSFFDRRDDEDADEDVEVEDLESILDECMGANLPTLQLNWHYRSLNESLIAFSNHRYYQGRLITFPSPHTSDTAVQFHAVDGMYERGGSRTNKEEARAVVAAMIDRLQANSGRDTVGVVTFNSEQQRLIQDLLDEERRKDPGLDAFFTDDQIEPPFVKNLESVQGDERDFIFFSVTYGPDKTGRVSMNFGPLNQQGGQRRLNVAITRARKAVEIYSTMRPEHIDLSRTSAVGVRDLKHYLEFAERGVHALAEAVYGSRGDFDSPFEAAVAERLRDKGWIVHPQVGVSSFRIDLGVVHPDYAGRYLAGVECDGATYHSSVTARDRDFLREQVLRDLGWEILRIWSTDWWTDAAGALDKVHADLDALLEQDRKKIAAVESDESAGQEGEESDQSERLYARRETSVSQDNGNPSQTHADDEDMQPEFELRAFVEGHITPAIAYQETDLSQYQSVLDADRFFDRGYDGVLKDVLEDILRTEAPIRGDVVARRIGKAHGFARAGSRIRERVMKLVGRKYPRTREGEHVFIWPIESDVPESIPFRAPVDGSMRPVEEIPLQELIGLAQAISSKWGGRVDEVVNRMASELGLQRVREVTRKRLKTALEQAQSHQ